MIQELKNWRTSRWVVGGLGKFTCGESAEMKHFSAACGECQLADKAVKGLRHAEVAVASTRSPAVRGALTKSRNLEKKFQYDPNGCAVRGSSNVT